MPNRGWVGNGLMQIIIKTPSQEIRRGCVTAPKGGVEVLLERPRLVVGQAGVRPNQPFLDQKSAQMVR